jgi:hypothetical protein
MMEVYNSRGIELAGCSQLVCCALPFAVESLIRRSAMMVTTKVLPSAMIGKLESPNKDARPTLTPWEMIWITTPKANKGHNHELDVSSSQLKL